MKSLFLSVNDTLYRSCIWIAGLSILAMTLIIPWGIFARYVLGTGSSWPEPVSILLMVVFTFVGAAASYRAGAHMAVGMITDRLPPLQRQLVALLVQVLMILVCVFMTYYGTKLCLTTWNQFLASLPGVRVGMTYAPIPVGGVLTLVFVLEKLLLGDQSNRKVVRFDHVEESEGAA
ncbi:TRAP transporter small permease [Pseudomonas putida]|uniref:TRAP transporter small permease n=1 Tax=Pseudomonas putida TaxID=303 RepID=UPI00274B0501|nr:TRAP transporter small permease [Pseudomonas putida]EKT4484758.1 TRAP transporter small permease [Pseudomonas putida]MDP9523319.1 TRAP transporter small permease [Pseudomonas putida]